MTRVGKGADYNIEVKKKRKKKKRDLPHKLFSKSMAPYPPNEDVPVISVAWPEALLVLSAGAISPLFLYHSCLEKIILAFWHGKYQFRRSRLFAHTKNPHPRTMHPYQTLGPDIRATETGEALLSHLVGAHLYWIWRSGNCGTGTYRVGEQE